MTIRIEENIPPHLVDVAQHIDKKIKILQEGGDPKSIFKEWELKELEVLGHADYLAMLKRIRTNIGIQDLGE